MLIAKILKNIVRHASEFVERQQLFLTGSERPCLPAEMAKAQKDRSSRRTQRFSIASPIATSFPTASRCSSTGALWNINEGRLDQLASSSLSSVA